MRCRVYNCKENENGFCCCSSYVEINENGECDSMYVPAEADNETNEDAVEDEE